MIQSSIWNYATIIIHKFHILYI